MTDGVTVLRLVDLGREGAYEMQSTEVDDPDAQCGMWWSDLATMSIVVVRSQLVITRYTRPAIKAELIPALWPRPDDSTVAVLPATAPAAPALRQRTEPVKAVTPGTPACACCGMPVEKHDGDDDQTPSGRLADRRCMECGRPMPGLKQATIQQMYNTMQRSINAMRADKPWNRRRGGKA
jgi:hypothetical protein